MKKINLNKILLITSGLLFLIIFPYTKKIEIFKAEDINWKIISNAKKLKEFDPKIFAFKETYMFSDEILKLNNSNIQIKGFLKKHKHKNHIDIILTEKITGVCFMCDHDEHYNFIMLKPLSENYELADIKDETYIKVKGRFVINREKNAHSIYNIENAELEEIIKLN